MSLRPSEREQMRKGNYKQSVDADESRRRRENQMVDIRKAKREESLQKRRHVGFPASAAGAVPAGHSSALQQKLEGLPALVQAVLSNDPNVQLEATTQFRKLLSIERSPPIEEVISTGVVPRFIEQSATSLNSKATVHHIYAVKATRK